MRLAFAALPRSAGRLLRAVLLLILLLWGAQPGRADDSIAYGMPITLAAIPAYVAAEKGFWSEEGLGVTPQMFSAGRLAVDALLSGGVQVMSVSETPLVHAMLQQHEIYIVLTVTRHQETKFIGRRDHGIDGPATLKGKTVATLAGTNSDYFMDRLLQAQNLERTDLKIVSLAPANMVTTLLRGDIDGYFAWEPYIFYSAGQMGPNADVIGPDDLYHGRHCIAMNQDYVRAHPQVVVKLVRGFIKAEVYVAAHPDEAQAIVAKYTHVDPIVLKSLWSEYQVKVELTQELLEILQSEADWIEAEDKSVVRPRSLASFVYTDALKAVRPSAVTISAVQGTQ